MFVILFMFINYYDKNVYFSVGHGGLQVKLNLEHPRASVSEHVVHGRERELSFFS